MKPVEVRIDAACVMEVVDAVQGAAEALASTWGMDAERCHFLGLAVREAVVNAIRHGRRESAVSRFESRLRSVGRRMVVTVSDRGPGFDPAGVPDPLEPQNVLKGSGRGIFYMRTFADTVSFAFPRVGGTVVRLEKRI